MNKKIVSIPTGEIEMLAIHEVNPLISKCQIKVCYVSDEPNRNKTLINKEAAKKLAVSLRGCPIVGKYNPETKDFEEHNELLAFDENHQLHLVADTTPYGFVDLNAPIWFQKFIDEGIEREYLVTEGWLWTEQFPECQRVITQGNNQSMEVPQKFLSGFWTETENLKSKFFIINDGLIAKLCILGEEHEPCFEGAQIAEHFSLNNGLQEKTFALMEKIQKTLEGGRTKMFEYTLEQLQGTPEYQALETSLQEAQTALDAKIGEYSALEEAKATEIGNLTASLNEAQENVNTLTAEKTGLETELEEVKNNYSALETEVNELREFKGAIEKQEKEAMIAKFHMLSDEDKKDVVENIDNYSLEEIEAKLSVLGVRKGMNFSLNTNERQNLTLNVGGNPNPNLDEVPDWVKAVQKKQNFDI